MITFDKYVCKLLTLDLNNQKDVDFLFRQLSLLETCSKEISIKILIKHIINEKCKTQGLIK